MRKPGAATGLTDAMITLTRALEDESELLALYGPSARSDLLATAKSHLSNHVMRISAAMDRLDPEWENALAQTDHIALCEAREELYKAAYINSEIILEGRENSADQNGSACVMPLRQMEPANRLCNRCADIRQLP